MLDQNINHRPADTSAEGDSGSLSDASLGRGCSLLRKIKDLFSNGSKGEQQMSVGADSGTVENLDMVKKDRPSTYQMQEVLPRLPIPELNSTAQKLLHWVRPILSEKEFAETEAALAEFTQNGGDGDKLQKALVEWSKQEGISSWFEPFWNDRYLKNRVPIAVNISPFFSFRDLGMEQISGAAALVRSTLEFKRAVDSEELPVEFERTDPLCMMQYKRIFSTERVPGIERDELKSPLSQNREFPSNSTHIVVLHQGNMFRMDVVEETGKPLATNRIEEGLKELVEASNNMGPNPDALGALTGMERPNWAQVREELRLLAPKNVDALNTIETALFAVAIETESAGDSVELMGDLLHGNPDNRWYDKSFTYIAYPDGKFGINFEHSACDGSTVMNMVTRVVQNSEDLRTEHNEGSAANFEPIAFELNELARTALAEAREGYQKLADSTSIEILHFDDFGKELIKTFGVSPDGFVQAAFHLAQQRSWGFVGTTYESAMTRRFLHGRTEALRTVTPEVVDFVSAMEDQSVSRDEVRSKLKAAAFAHVARMKECKKGQGIDRHLFGLLSIWERKGQQLGIYEKPKIFDSPGWLKMRHDILSTSRLDSKDIEHVGFGPTNPDCTGIQYSICGDDFMFVMSARSDRKDELEAFSSNLKRALNDMAELMGE